MAGGSRTPRARRPRRSWSAVWPATAAPHRDGTGRQRHRWRRLGPGPAAARPGAGLGDGDPATLRRPQGVRPWQHVLEPLRGYLLYVEALAGGRRGGPRRAELRPDAAAGRAASAELVAARPTLARAHRGSGPAWTVPATPTSPRPASCTLDSSLAARELGWVSVLDWQTAVMTLDWFAGDRAGQSPARSRDQLATYSAIVEGPGDLTGPEPLTPRGVHVCRGCGAKALVVGPRPGRPAARERLLLAVRRRADAFFPLHLRICSTCGLGQVGEFVRPERIFGDYPYLSSVSSSWLAHAKTLRRDHDQRARPGPDGGLVVEVASNDGYLLREFAALGVPVLGVEPAANVADIARSHGVRTLTAFFGRERPRRIVAEHGRRRLVAANNVMAHVPDLDDFVGGLDMLCDADTVVTVENPSFVTLLNETQFDTIYHEHFSYLSAHAVSLAVARQGLELVGVDDLTTHGGSYRYTIARAGSRPTAPTVLAAVERELSEGLLSPQTWTEFADRSRETISGLRAWLEQRAAEGGRVAGYGAAAKGNTLLNAAGVGEKDITAVADGSPEKQGRLLPGSRIPIVAPPRLVDTGATDVLILPWNIAPEIAPLVRELLPDATCWVAVPEMRALGNAG